MWTFKLIDASGIVWDETSYGGNSCNTIATLKSDLQWFVDHPEEMESDGGRHIVLSYSK